jgi:peptidoglycan/xylan/chitin deacetylase (PgdA/CDA1 family)
MRLKIDEVRFTRRDALAMLAAVPPALAATRPQVAITIDDVNWAAIPQPYREDANRRILQALKQRAALFVVGANVDSEEGHAIVRNWSERGHIIGNHTWSHRPFYNSIDPAEFAQDMLRCDQFVKTFPGFRPLFRFPALKEGTTRERRDWMRAFLREHGYRNGAVTIDASDWYYDSRLRAHLTEDPKFDVDRFRKPYLTHISDRAQYYDTLIRKVTGHTIPHTLLIHFNLLNSLFLGDVLSSFEQTGWQIIDADVAFSNKSFQRQPDTAPAGESLVWALAKETGRYENKLRYPGEDDAYEKPILDRQGL